MTLLYEAFKHIGQGFSIFPVEPQAKTPIRIYQDRSPDDAPWTIRWSEVATTDPNKVLEWWQWCPDANIGVACGPSKLLVVDLDRGKTDGNLKDTPFKHLHGKYGPRVDGEMVFYEVCDRYGGPGAAAYCWDTYMVATGSGGWHMYFWWPEDVRASQASIVRGVVDIRCNGGDRGGYVLGAGSQTDKGGYVVELDVPIRPAPDWLVELCRERPSQPAPLGKQADVLQQPRSVNFGGLVDSVRLAQQGNRNNALLWAARAMCSDGATEDEACDLLVPAALQCGLDGGERQARQTIRSAYRLQRAKVGT